MPRIVSCDKATPTDQNTSCFLHFLKSKGALEPMTTAETRFGTWDIEFNDTKMDLRYPDGFSVTGSKN